MKQLLGSILAVFLTIGLMAFAVAQEDLTAHKSCKYCGMDRSQFAQSRLYIDYGKGVTTGTCSLHCAAIELASSIDVSPEAIWVGDFNTKKLIDVEKAIWVVGGNKPGVMTRRAKWAFEFQADAEAFLKENGGKTATFDEAVKASFEDMYDDVKMIRERRAARRKAMEQRP